jgi:hypothetical protein
MVLRILFLTGIGVYRQNKIVGYFKQKNSHIKYEARSAECAERE